MQSNLNRNLIILLHGVGSNGANLAPLGQVWQDKLSRTDFASPDGPFAFDHGPGRQWFSINGVTEANRPQRVAEARVTFDQTLSEIIAAHGLTDNLERVALVGFSQGSIMALDAVASGRLPVGAVVAFSGRLASPSPLTPADTTPVLLIHGTADPVMPVSESQLAAQALRELGVDASVHTLAGVGHSISPEGAALAVDFLAKVLDR
jgi:phospholipase/carboxylesterase